MEHGAYTGAGNLTCTGTGEPSVPATVLTLFDMFCSGLPPAAWMRIGRRRKASFEKILRLPDRTDSSDPVLPTPPRFPHRGVGSAGGGFLLPPPVAD
mgnify:CR=1 FL=1